MNQKIKRNLVMDAKVAEILGVFIGDGWLEKRERGLFIAGDKIEDKEYYDKYLGPLFSKVFSKVEPREFSYWGVYGICCYKRDVIRKCVDIGFQSGSKTLNAKIPIEIMKNANDKIKKAILRGIFDADGSFWCEKSRAKTSTEWKRTYHYHPELQIGSCSKELLLQIKKLLQEFKIDSKVVLKTKAGRKFNRNVNNSYALKIRKIEQIKRWFEIIGSSNPRHQTRYAVWKKFGFLPPRTNINQRKDMTAGKLDPNSFY